MLTFTRGNFDIFTIRVIIPVNALILPMDLKVIVVWCSRRCQHRYIEFTNNGNTDHVSSGWG